MDLMRCIPIVLIIACAQFACGGAAGGSDEVAMNAPVPTVGEQLFNTHCTLCHGRKGNLRMNGAKDLVKSTLKREEMIALVTNGRNAMMPYKNALKPKEIEAVVEYALSLRAPE